MLVGFLVTADVSMESVATVGYPLGCGIIEAATVSLSHGEKGFPAGNLLDHRNPCGTFLDGRRLYAM